MLRYTYLRNFSLAKPYLHLLGEGIRPEHLNDDRLGRVLDKLYSAGLTEVFVTVALSAARKFGVKMDSLHLDSSSFHVDGEYRKNPQNEEAQAGVIEITYGYSRDHRPDLKPIFRSPSPADGKFVKAQHIYASSPEFHPIQDPIKLGSEPIAKIKHYDIEAEKIVGGQS